MKWDTVRIQGILMCVMSVRDAVGSFHTSANGFFHFTPARRRWNPRRRNMWLAAAPNIAKLPRETDAVAQLEGKGTF